MVAVLFDMDGVVIDSETAWTRAKRAEIFPRVVPDADVDPGEVTGMYYEEIYDYLAEHYNVAVDRETCLDLFEQAGRDIYGGEATLMDGFEALLADIDNGGAQVALVTSSPHRWIDLVVDQFGLKDAFDAVVSGTDVDAGKPAPDIYQLAARELGEDPAGCIAVEDSTNGARSATAAGTFCVGYTGVHDELDRSIPDVIASDPKQLRAVLLERIDEAH
ncbi:HAD superfamily hydrolase [Halapricum desulfuricans]|uniref:HAD superfamily hydrolase n=1 Tax=Halapricum desulfuricans TaxID=2841257 RepID=A0A897NP08_9EURY|nr:HAD family phosphatase [Halapricum desulfuricans]QSG13195.1 HAD superfamily hydrolase [Halapricum desulfuricans]